MHAINAQTIGLVFYGFLKRAITNPLPERLLSSYTQKEFMNTEISTRVYEFATYNKSLPRFMKKRVYAVVINR